MKQPLAHRMRPTNITEVIGQEHVVGEGKILWRMVQAKHLQSMILYGPPGTGKTSIASAIAGSIGMPFRLLNAVTHNKKDMEVVVQEAKMHRHLILILDEVHRLDKGKQDFLLPHLESGLITLIGATTSNPFHAINSAIRSRCQIFELHALTEENILQGLQRALTDQEKGLGEYNVTVTTEALRHFASASGGDMRSAYNALELAVLSSFTITEETAEITLEIAEECLQKKSFVHDKGGDAHYDVLSAFQKSVRGSDVNAVILKV